MLIIEQCVNYLSIKYFEYQIVLFGTVCNRTNLIIV
nr:MAG TPA: hypothetical protein [Caudoviricetes sp.]